MGTYGSTEILGGTLSLRAATPVQQIDKGLRMSPDRIGARHGKYAGERNLLLAAHTGLSTGRGSVRKFV